ncbi:hypothetical protein [Natrialba sp. SSL1]|uniref:hypothetical protein n=1 Tax=Natrialba sp. SSL1 TaxID=1869245 RepID=UPI0008F95C16|nr:hypothetical protein [Natrialba sp. SSL1]OIB56126.1 hypothetical protein BBD46_19780 [Natrialba sp. SSL1]
MTNDTPNPNADYEQLNPLRETVDSLQENAIIHSDLADNRRPVRHCLFQIGLHIQKVREILPDSDSVAELVIQSVIAAGGASLDRSCEIRIDKPRQETRAEPTYNTLEAKTPHTASPQPHLGGETDG